MSKGGMPQRSTPVATAAHLDLTMCLPGSGLRLLIRSYAQRSRFRLWISQCASRFLNQTLDFADCFQGCGLMSSLHAVLCEARARAAPKGHQ
eukprot:2618302-Alexandrium_andersonii.AAC.1